MSKTYYPLRSRHSSKNDETRPDRDQPLESQAISQLAQIARPEVAQTRNRNMTEGTSFVPRLDKFDHEKDDPYTFIENFEALSKAHKCNTAIMMTNLRSLLIGSALDWFCGLSEEVLSNFELFKEKFLGRFSKISKQPSDVLAYIFDRKQRPNESVLDYVSDIQRQAKRSKVKDHIVFSAIYNGVLPEIKADVIRQSPEDLVSLIHCAEISEKANKVMPSKTPLTEKAMINLFREAVKNDIQQEIKKDINALARDLQSSISSLSFQNQNRPGHSFSNRPSNSQNFRKQSRRDSKDSFRQRPQVLRGKQNHNSNQASYDRCSRCGRRGHSYSNCWFRTLQCNKCKQIGHKESVCQSDK